MDNRLSKCEDVDQKKDISNPLVSIIAPVFNGSKYLEASIQSVLMQSYPYIEHVFVDGGSTDGTVELLTKYQSKFPDKIRYISEPDKGPGPAINKGLRMATGDIFGLLCSDDLYEPDAIMSVVEFFRKNPNAYFVFGGCNYIDEKGKIIGKYPVKDLDIKELINETCAIPTPAAFYKREVIDKVGLYNDTIGNDFEFDIRVAKVFKIHRIEKVLSNFRIHKGSQTTGSNKEIRKMTLRKDCIVSRRYGGRYFSGYCRGYYTFVIIEGLRPVLGSFYPLLRIIKQVIHKK